MRFHAYLLAADPTWIATSLQAYVPFIDKLVVSFDERHLGWTGSQVAVEPCLAAIRKLDSDGKTEFAPGDFRAMPGESLLEAETRQRKVAFTQAAAGADWVLQIDSDEVLPRWDALVDVLVEADRLGLSAVEWPMRILYRRLRDGRYLEVVTDRGTPHYEYPGPIAVRPHVLPIDCRRVPGPFLRPVVAGDLWSLQVQQAPGSDEHRVDLSDPSDAIWHNSWARASADVRAKVRSWGHNQGLKSWIYYYSRWLPAPLAWRGMRRFHPLYPGLWPRLAVTELPFSLVPPDDER